MEKIFNSGKVKLTTLTPVHIGCGDEYLPTNYVIKDNKLFYADSDKIFENLNQSIKLNLERQLAGRVTAEFLLQYAKLLNNNSELLSGVAKFSVPVCQDFPMEYSIRLEEKLWNNDFAIGRTYFNPMNYSSIIPGSSIKGAIRTAFIDHLRKKEPFINHEDMAKSIYNDRGTKELDKYIRDLLKYKNMSDDRMKYLRIEDVALGSSDKRKIYYAVNYRKNGSVRNEKELATRLETIDFGDVGFFNVNMISRDIIEHSLEVTHDEKLSALYCENHPIDELQSVNDLAKICNQMFIPLFKDELNTLLDSRNISEVNYNKLFDVLDEVNQQKDTKFLLKIGKHSGAEGVTLGNRKIKVMGKGRQYYMANNSTTFWLASEVKPKNKQMLPFGWVLCEIC